MCAKVIDGFLRLWYNHRVNIVNKVQNIRFFRSGYDICEWVLKRQPGRSVDLVFTVCQINCRRKRRCGNSQCFPHVILVVVIMIWRVIINAPKANAAMDCAHKFHCPSTVVVYATDNLVYSSNTALC